MAVTSDKVFLRSFRWLGASVQWMQNNIPEVGVPPLPNFPLKNKMGDALRTQLGLELRHNVHAVDGHVLERGLPDRHRRVERD